MIHWMFHDHIVGRHTKANMQIYFCWPRKFHWNKYKKGIAVTLVVDGLPTKGVIDYDNKQFFKKFATADTTAKMISILKEHRRNG